MNNRRGNFIKFISLLAIVVCLIANIPTATAASTVSVAVLATSDLHGNILNYDYLSAKVPSGQGLVKISTLVTRERGKYPYNILVDNGDFLQGTPLVAYYATVDKTWTVHPMVSVFNYMKYDAINIGNHEFNFGLDLLKRTAINSNAKFLSANTRDTLTNNPWQHAKPYIIKEIPVSNTTGVPGDQLRIGIIGTVTPAIPNFESPSNYAGLKFTSQEEAINQSIAALKQQKVDAIVVLSHSGVESSSYPYPENGIIAIATKCPGINLIVSGHSHVTIDNNHDITTDGVTYPRGIINGVPIMAPNRWGYFLSEGLLNFEKVNGKWQVQNVTTANISTIGVADNPAIVTMARSWDAATKAYLATPLGNSTATYLGVNGDKMYTPLVDLVNQVQLYYGNADVSAAACFNSDAMIPQGTVNLQNVSSVYIYENFMYTIQITGKQLKQYLEATACYFDQVAAGTPVDGLQNTNYLQNVTTKTAGWPSYNYDMLTGVNYRINISKPMGSRIENLTYTKNGQPVNDADTIKLALNNYRFNGGGPKNLPASVFPQAKGLPGFMAAMGLDALGRNGLAKPVVLWDSQKALSDAGQVRSLMAKYIQMKGTISPNTTANWKLTSN